MYLHIFGRDILLTAGCEFTRDKIDTEKINFMVEKVYVLYSKCMFGVDYRCAYLNVFYRIYILNSYNVYSEYP